MKKHDDIKKGLECCMGGSCEPYCPYEETVDCVRQMAEDTLAYIKQLEAQVPKWVSVKERLPEKTITACLVYADGYTRVADWTHDKWGEDFWFYVDGEYDPEVTHWMPLPEPPNENRAAIQVKSAAEFAERKVIKE